MIFEFKKGPRVTTKTPIYRSTRKKAPQKHQFQLSPPQCSPHLLLQ
jgi:hypothetical protein